MQTASELREKGVRRTKVTRDDGHVFVTLESPDFARTLFTPEDGFTAITEVYGYDPDLDGPPREPRGKGLSDLLAKLDEDELAELATRLNTACGRALDLQYEGIDDEGHGGFEDSRYVTYEPVYYELDSVSMLVFNERNTRYLGCRWTSCAVCRHESCGFCPACNSGEIAPNGEIYGDVEDMSAECCH